VFEPGQRDHVPMGDEKQCGRKADWITIGEVSDLGLRHAVLTCRECYKKRSGKSWFEDWFGTDDELVPASQFKDEIGRDPMCGDDFAAVISAIYETTADVEDEPVKQRDLTRWERFEAIDDRLVRIATDRRLQRLERAVGFSSVVVAAIVAKWVANELKSWSWLPSGTWAQGAVLFLVFFGLGRFLRVGLFKPGAKTRR
jgi:hypothetical protein